MRRGDLRARLYSYLRDREAREVVAAGRLALLLAESLRHAVHTSRCTDAVRVFAAESAAEDMTTETCGTQTQRRAPCERCHRTWRL